jgi:tetratricopeptide (TPR) repeat protein
LAFAEGKLRELSSPNRDVERELGWILTELGHVLHSLGWWSAAEEKLREAIIIRRNLVANAMRQETKAASLCLADAFSPSESANTASIPMGTHGSERRVQTERRSLATSLNIYGNILTGRYNGTLAETAQREALTIREELVGKLPVCFQRHLAKCLNDLGNALFYQGQFQAAIVYYERALVIRRDLVPRAESSLGQYVARTCNNIGNAYRKLGQWQAAEASLGEAVRIYRAGLTEYAAAFSDLLARTLSNLGRVYHHQGRLKNAIEALEESDRLHALAYDISDKTPPFDWIENCNYLAMAYLQSGMINYATFALKRVSNLLERGDKICRRNTAMLRAYTWNTNAKVLIHSRNEADWVAAISLLLESERLRLRLQCELDCAAALQLEFAEIWHNLGCATAKLKRFSEAKGYLTDALTLRRRIAQHNGLYASRLVARSALELADILFREGSAADALRLYLEAEDRFSQLNQSCPAGYRRELERAQKGRIRLQGESFSALLGGTSVG